jgi:hypothetical protein
MCNYNPPEIPFEKLKSEVIFKTLYENLLSLKNDTYWKNEPKILLKTMSDKQIKNLAKKIVNKNLKNKSFSLCDLICN